MPENRPAPMTVDTIAQALATAIVTGHFRPGNRLPAENQLAEDFGVSRPTVRNALKKLAGLGLTESRRGSGHTVREWWTTASPEVLGDAVAHMDLKTTAGRALVTDILDARIALCGMLLRQVSVRRDDSILLEAEIALTGVQQARGILPAENTLFAIYARAQPNAAIRMSVSAILSPWRAVVERLQIVPPDPNSYLDELRRIHQSVAMGMADEAISRMRPHFTALDIEIRRALLD